METNANNNLTGNTGTTTTAMALAAGNFTSRILQPADFKALDGLIQTLGDKSANLTPDEKTSAIAVINEWNESVTSRIQVNAEQAKSVLAFLDGQSVYGTQLQDIMELFHETLGDTPEYEAYRKAVEAYADVQADRPLDVPVDGDMTVSQSEQIQMANYAANLEHNRKIKMAQHDFNKAVKNYIKYLNGLDEIKGLRGSLMSYKNRASRMAAECKDKSTRAKLNVTISDPDVRKTLHEMMDFAKSV